MKRRVKYVLMFITVFVSTVFPAMGENEPIHEHFKLFGQCRQIFKATAEDKLAFLSELSKLPKVSEAVTAEVELLKVRLLIDLEKYDEAMAIIQKYTTSYQEVMPEWYYMNIHILQQEKKIEEHDIVTYTPLVNAIPFSRIALKFDEWHSYSKLRKHSEETGSGCDIHFMFKPFPIKARNLVVVSELYAANNMLDRARDINLIILYSQYPLQTTTSSILRNKRNYFSFFYNKEIIATVKGQSLWRFVGQVENRNKNSKLALLAFLRAAYDEPETANALYEEWQQDWFANIQDAQYMNAEDAEFIAGEFAGIFNKSPYRTYGDFFPWALDAMRESKNINNERIKEYVDIFKGFVEWQVNGHLDYRYLGVPAKDITDYENFHIPTPSETFWREDLLYVPKK